jgi:hypothetical protein
MQLESRKNSPMMIASKMSLRCCQKSDMKLLKQNRPQVKYTELYFFWFTQRKFESQPVIGFGTGTGSWGTSKSFLICKRMSS